MSAVPAPAAPTADNPLLEPSPLPLQLPPFAEITLEHCREALLAGMAYVFVNNGLALDAPVATPTIPALTPPGPAATLTVEPTLVPTAAATMAAPLAPSP